MDEEKQTTEMKPEDKAQVQPEDKAQPVANQEKSETVDSEQSGEEKLFDLKSWKDWLIIALALIVIGGGISLFF